MKVFFNAFICTGSRMMASNDGEHHQGTSQIGLELVFLRTSHVSVCFRTNSGRYSEKSYEIFRDKSNSMWIKEVFIILISDL